MDMNGSVVLERETVNEGQSIDISQCKAGVYIVRITDGQQVRVQKLIKN